MQVSFPEHYTILDGMKTRDVASVVERLAESHNTYHRWKHDRREYHTHCDREHRTTTQEHLSVSCTFKVLSCSFNRFGRDATPTRCFLRCTQVPCE